MDDKELKSIWKLYDEKIENVIALNKEIVIDITKGKLDKTIGKMTIPKLLILLLGIFYTLALYGVTFAGFMAGGVFVTIGFGLIATLMSIILGNYIYQIFLINQITSSDDIVSVQKQLSQLKISSFNTVRIAIIQIPLWSICHMSLIALSESPVIYGGIHLIIFIGLSYLTYWLYNSLSLDRANSKVSQFFLSGFEWEPIVASSKILEQLKEYRDL